MRISALAFCLIVSISCGKQEKKTMLNENNTTITEIKTPKVKLLQSKLHFTDNDYFFNSKQNIQNLFIRKKLLKKVSENFKSKTFKLELEHLESLSLLNEKDFLNIKESGNLIRLDQTFNVYSKSNNTTFTDIKGFIGHPEKILDYVSLSKSIQDSEEIIFNNINQERSFSAKFISQKDFDSFKSESKNIDLFIENFNIISNQVTVSFKQKIEELLKTHYRLFLSTPKFTKVYYIKPNVSFFTALKHITNNQILTDKDQNILNLLGYQNYDHQYFLENINFNSTFIKLFNFQNQSIKEIPVAGNSYAINIFSLKELLKNSSKKNLIDQQYKYNSETDFIINLKTQSKPRLVIKTHLREKEYSVKLRKIKAFYYKKLARNLRSAFLACTVTFGEKILKHDFITKLNYDIIANSDVGDLIHKSDFFLKEHFINSNDIVLKTNLKKESLSYGHIDHDCKIENDEHIFDVKTKKRLHLRKMKSPKYEYLLDLKVDEYAITL